MGRVINSTAMTVDSVIDVSDWFVGEGDHDAAGRTILQHSEAMLLGRKTYEGLAGYWQTASGPWAELINPMPKYVASRHSPGQLEWNATAIDGDAIEGVRRLKAEHDGDFFMSGCGELARELIQAGLVDELHFWIHPRIQGPGARPYEGAAIPVRLIDTTGFDSGVTFVRYEPVLS